MFEQKLLVFDTANTAMHFSYFSERDNAQSFQRLDLNSEWRYMNVDKLDSNLLRSQNFFEVNGLLSTGIEFRRDTLKVQEFDQHRRSQKYGCEILPTPEAVEAKRLEILQKQKKYEADEVAKQEQSRQI